MNETEGFFFTFSPKPYKIPNSIFFVNGAFGMYAVIEQGGKQYKVACGDVVNIDLAEVAEGATSIELDKVLFINDEKEVRFGSPYIKGAKVVASFAEGADNGVVKGPKLYPMHFRKRKNSQRKMGHRQKYLQVKIEEIVS